MQKKILIIEDLSTIGKTSLATAIPVLGSFGHAPCAIPTAILSANTAYEGYTFLDLSNELNKILKHLTSLKEGFSALYTGYLGSAYQIEIISDYLKNNPSLNYYLDPAMADNGSFYQGFDEEFVKKLLKLVRKAKVIIPNYTEAIKLTNSKDNTSVLDLLKRLSCLGPKNVIITGVIEGNEIANYAYDALNDVVYKKSYLHLEKSYYGTGDLFASLIVGAMEGGLGLEKALELAGDFLYKAILASINAGNCKLDGVLFEPYLYLLGGKANE